MKVERLLFGQQFDVPKLPAGVPLPASFRIGPGSYFTAGGYWDMSQPGVYFIFNAQNQQTTRRAVTDSEPLHVASVMATICRHSVRDNAMSFPDLDAAARSRYLGLSCGAISPWMRSWMLSTGWQARIVRFYTMETPNGYGDSHVAVEVRRSSVPYPWTLVDSDLARFYEDDQGNRLSALAFTQRVSDWDLVVKPLADQNRLDTAPPLPGPLPTSFDYATTNLFSFGTPEKAQAWTQRTCQAVGIDAANGLCYFLLPPGAEGRKAWLEAQQPINRVDNDPAVWMQRFYPVTP